MWIRLNLRSAARNASSIALVKPALLFATAVVLSACSGSGGSGTDVASSGGNDRVNGRAVKGVIGDARIDVFPADAQGQAVSTRGIENTTTALDGSFDLTPVSEPTIVMSTGGSFVDEADQDPEGDGRNQIELGPNDFLESVLFPGETSVAITPYTQLLVDKARREVTGNNFQQVIEKNRQIAIDAFGFDPFTTMPADPTAPGSAPLDERRYALLVGGVANAINRVSIELGFPEPRFAIIQAIIADLSDGVLDGLENGSAVSFLVDSVSYTLPTNIELNGEIGRFANNNFDAYGGLRTTVNESVLATSGANEAPLSTGNAGFNLTAGGNRTLSAADFAVTDPDAGPEALVFSVTALPNRADIDLRGGELDLGDTFTLTDLQNGDLNYSDVGAGAGADSFSVLVNDGADELAVTVSVVIGTAAENNPPVITGTLSFTLEDFTSFTLTPSEFAATDPDIGPASALSVFLDVPPGRGDLLRNGVVLSTGFAFTIGDVQQGLVTYQAASGQGDDSDSFELSVSDGEVSSMATITVTITAPAGGGNIAPVASDGAIELDEGDDTTSQAAAFDEDGNELTYRVVSDPQNGTVELQPSSGSFTYIHDGSETISDSFTFVVNDGEEDSNVATVTISINPVNDLPTVDGGFSVEIGHSKVLGPSDFNVSDPDSDPADRIYEVVGVPPHGRFTVNGVRLNDSGEFTEADIVAGRVSYKHDGTPGDTNFILNVNDGSVIVGQPIDITVDNLDVAATDYHAVFFYPLLGDEFGQPFSEIGFNIEQDTFTTDVQSGTTVFNFPGPLTETDLTIEARQGDSAVNYSASLITEIDTQGDPGTEMFTVTPHGELQLLLPTEREFSFDEIVHARSVRFIPADLEFGILLAGTQHTFEEFGTAELNGDGAPEELDASDFSGVQLEQNLFLIVEKSTNATNATLNGDYGTVEFDVTLNDVGTGETGLVSFLNAVNFDGAGALSGLTEQVSSLFRVPGNTPLISRSNNTFPGSDSGTYTVSADGTMTFGDSNSTEKGFVSADGSLFFTPFMNVDQGTAENLIEGENSVIFGVRRDPAPVLEAGASFRLQGFQICYGQDGKTEIERFVRNSLSFGTSGVSLNGQRSVAVRPGDTDPAAFLPVFLNDSVNLTFSGSTGGELTFEGSGNGRDYQLNGFLADTGRIMILNIETDDLGTAADARFCQGIAMAVRDTGFDLDNTPPIAVIANLPTEPILAGESVTLNSQNSTDADGDTLAFSWFATAGNFDTTTGSQVVYTAPADGTSAVRIYLTASDGDFQSVTFGTVAYRDPDPSVDINETGSVEQGHSLAIENQLLQTNDFDTAPDALIYMIDNGPENGRLLLNGSPITIGVTFTQDDIDSGNLSYQQSGRALTSDSFDFTVSDGNAEDSGTFNITVTQFDANATLQGISFLLGYKEADLNNPIQQTGVIENDSEAVYERTLTTQTGNQVLVESRFTSEQTGAELVASENIQSSGGVVYSITAEQASDPADIFTSIATLLPSGLFREGLDRVEAFVDGGNQLGDVIFPGAANFIPLDLENGLYIVAFTDREQTFGVVDTTGDGQPNSVDPDNPIESDTGFFYEVFAEKPTSASRSTLNGNYRSVSFKFAFDDANTGEVSAATGLTDLVFDGVAEVSGGNDGRDLTRIPGGSPEVTRISDSDPAAFDGSSYSVSSDGLMTFTDPNSFTFDGFVTIDGSFYAHRLAQIEGSITSPSSVDQFVEYGVRVGTAEPNLANRRFLGELQVFCFGPESDSRIERRQQADIQFNADGSAMTLESLVLQLNHISDTEGVSFESESRRTESFNVTGLANGGFRAAVNINGSDFVIDGAVSENGRVLLLRYGLNGMAGNGQNCEGIGLAGADIGQEVINERPTISVQSSNTGPVNKGDVVTLTATASDADGNTPAVAWVASGGTLSSTTGLSVTWTAPSGNAPDGIARIYATATDGDLPVTTSVDIGYQDL